MPTTRRKKKSRCSTFLQRVVDITVENYYALIGLYFRLRVAVKPSGGFVSISCSELYNNIVTQ